MHVVRFSPCAREEVLADGRGANSDAQKAVDFDRAACLVVLIEKVKPENEVAGNIASSNNAH